MKTSKTLKHSVIFGLLMLILMPLNTAVAQQGSLQITVPANIQTAQTIDLKALGQAVAGGTATEKLFDVVLTNISPTEVNNLRVYLTVTAANGDILAEIIQNEPGFSMDGNQRVAANSYTILNGIPGIEERFDFDASDIDDVLTSEGERFFNKTKGVISNNLLTVKIQILDANYNVWASGQVVLGAGSTSAPVTSFEIRSPGASQADGGREIGTKYPQFSWDGPSNTTYRVVVVEESGGSAEALLENAFSSLPTIEDGIVTNSGQLNAEEMVDATIEKTSFDYPPTGVQQLQEGKTYYWQVETQITGNNGVETVRSEIWEFSIVSATGGQVGISAQLKTAISGFVAEGQIDKLVEEGYSIQSVTIGNNTYQSSAAITKQLTDLAQKLAQGEISLQK